MRPQDLCPQEWLLLHQTIRRALRHKFSTFNMDDVVQQTSLHLLDKVSEKDFESFDHLKCFAILIARNWCINQLKRSYREVIMPDTPDMSYISCVDFLDLKRLEISTTVLAWLEGHTLREISEDTQKSIPAVHKALHKDLQHLRLQLS